jgi:hypothetical protein
LIEIFPGQEENRGQIREYSSISVGCDLPPDCTERLGLILILLAGGSISVDELHGQILALGLQYFYII